MLPTASQFTFFLQSRSQAAVRGLPHPQPPRIGPRSPAHRAEPSYEIQFRVSLTTTQEPSRSSTR